MSTDPNQATDATPTLTYAQLQSEIGSWALANFGHNESRPLTVLNTRTQAYYAASETQMQLDRLHGMANTPADFPAMALGSLCPLMGMGEEIGEFIEAHLHGDRADALDALGDIGVYLMDYTAREGVNIQGIVEPAHEAPKVERAHFVSYNYFRLLHVTLKHHQGIRGLDNLDHYQHQRDAILADLVAGVQGLCVMYNANWLDVINVTWASVIKKRNWKLAPNDGGGATHKPDPLGDALGYNTTPSAPPATPTESTYRVWDDYTKPAPPPRHKGGEMQFPN